MRREVPGPGSQRLGWDDVMPVDDKDTERQNAPTRIGDRSFTQRMKRNENPGETLRPNTSIPSVFLTGGKRAPAEGVTVHKL